jgi:hypothetical protein
MLMRDFMSMMINGAASICYRELFSLPGKIITWYWWQFESGGTEVSGRQAAVPLNLWGAFSVVFVSYMLLLAIEWADGLASTFSEARLIAGPVSGFMADAGKGRMFGGQSAIGRTFNSSGMGFLSSRTVGRAGIQGTSLVGGALFGVRDSSGVRRGGAAGYLQNPFGSNVFKEIYKGASAGSQAGATRAAIRVKQADNAFLGFERAERKGKDGVNAPSSVNKGDIAPGARDGSGVPGLTAPSSAVEDLVLETERERQNIKDAVIRDAASKVEISQEEAYAAYKEKQEELQRKVNDQTNDYTTEKMNQELMDLAKDDFKGMGNLLIMQKLKESMQRGEVDLKAQVRERMQARLQAGAKREGISEAQIDDYKSGVREIDEMLRNEEAVRGQMAQQLQDQTAKAIQDQLSQEEVYQKQKELAEDVRKEFEDGNISKDQRDTELLALAQNDMQRAREELAQERAEGLLTKGGNVPIEYNTQVNNMFAQQLTKTAQEKGVSLAALKQKFQEMKSGKPPSAGDTVTLNTIDPERRQVTGQDTALETPAKPEPEEGGRDIDAVASWLFGAGDDARDDDKARGLDISDEDLQRALMKSQEEKQQLAFGVERDEQKEKDEAAERKKREEEEEEARKRAAEEDSDDA